MTQTANHTDTFLSSTADVLVSAGDSTLDAATVKLVQLAAQLAGGAEGARPHDPGAGAGGRRIVDRRDRADRASHKTNTDQTNSNHSFVFHCRLP